MCISLSVQMNFGGEKAYFLEMGKQASLNNVYKIFDQDKPNLNCVSVAEQKQFMIFSLLA